MIFVHRYLSYIWPVGLWWTCELESTKCIYVSAVETIWCVLFILTYQKQSCLRLQASKFRLKTHLFQCKTWGREEVAEDPPWWLTKNNFDVQLGFVTSYCSLPLSACKKHPLHLCIMGKLTHEQKVQCNHSSLDHMSNKTMTTGWYFFLKNHVIVTGNSVTSVRLPHFCNHV